jgi:hypothetical protein
MIAAALLMALPICSHAQSAAGVASSAAITLSPSQGQQGQTLSIVAQGLPCQGLASLSFSPPGLQVVGLHCQQQAATLAAAVSNPAFTLVISPSAPPGPYTMTATYSNGKPPIQKQAAFMVTSAPVTAAQAAAIVLNPNSGQQGQTLTVEAVGLRYSAALTIAFQPAGLSVAGIRRSERGTQFVLAIAETATPGPYALVYRMPDSYPQQIPSAFTVTPAAPTRQAAPPSVETASPATVEQGGTYTIEFTGHSFQPQMQIGFGSDVTALGPVLYKSPTTASLMVMISPAAQLGDRLAKAKNPGSSWSEGPAKITVIKKGTRPSISPVQGLTKVQEVKPPHGKITLVSPNVQGSGEFKQVKMWDDPPMIVQGTQFTWYEDNPGIAKYFVLQILDKDGKVLAEAQLPGAKRYYNVTKALLQSLPDGSKMPFFHWELEHPPVMASQAGLFSGANASAENTLQTNKVVGQKVNTSKIAIPSEATVQAFLASTGPNNTGLADFNMIAGFLGMTKTDKAQATWQVKGYWEHPITKEMQEVETSPTYPLRLPDVPKGMLVCDNAAQPGVLKAICMSSTGEGQCFAPATYSLQGKISVAKDPYPVSVTMASLQTMTLEYSNVYISWGDGTVEPLRVDSGPNLNSDEITLILHGDGKNQGIMHTYSESGDYDVKIYSLPSPEKQDPVTPALGSSTGLYSLAYRSLAGAGGLASQQQGAAIPAVTLSGISTQTASSLHNAVNASAGGVSASSAGGVSFQGAAATGNAAQALNPSVLGLDAYLIACTQIHVEEPPDMDAEGPIHLVKVEVTDFPGYSTKPPKVSDCAEAFTAKATLSYYGHGNIVYAWTVDGQTVGFRFAQMPKGKKNPLATYQIESDPLPVSLQQKPHGVCIRVKAFVETGEIAKVLSSGIFETGEIAKVLCSDISCSSTPSGGGPYSALTTTTTTVMRPSTASFAGVGQVVSAGAGFSPATGAMPAVQQGALASSAYVGLSQSSQAGSSNLSFMQVPPLMIQVTQQQTDWDVWSPAASYQVVPHDPNIPCNLLFTAKDGPFKISDLTALAQESDGTYSGSGKLHLAVPSGQDGYEPLFVPISFSHLTLEGTGDSRTATAGKLDAAVNPPKEIAGGVAGLDGSVTKVTGQAGESNPLNVTFALSVSGLANLTPKNKPLSFTATGPITADGDFYADDPALKLPPGEIGHSGFYIEGTQLIVDWSRKEGGPPPSQACSQTSSGNGWVGLVIKQGKMTPYDFGQGSLGFTPPIDGWYISWSGVSGEIRKTPLSKTFNLNGFNLRLTDLYVKLCGSSLQAKYGVVVKNVPLLEADLTGFLQMDMQSNLCSLFSYPPGASHHDFGTVSLDLATADFSMEANYGWRVALGGTFTFRAQGDKILEKYIDGLRITGSGGCFWKDGSSGATLPLGGSTHMGPVKVDLVQLGIKLGTASGQPKLEFALDANFLVSEVLPPSSNTFKYTMQAVNVNGVDPVEAGEPTTMEFALKASYPEGSPTATLDAKVTYSKDAQGNTRFTGHGNLSILDTGSIGADFLLGYQGGKDYWLCRVSDGLPSPIPLYAPFISLYEIHGGMGHNVPLTSFASNGGLETLKPTLDGSYCFNAGVRVGDSAGGWVYTLQGDLSIKATGADAGFRIDIKAWLLTNDHSGDGQFQGFIQYAGSSFDAGLSCDYHLLGDAIWVKAPNGAVSIHFGPDGWHIYMGQNVDGLMLQAHVLVSDCKGYLMLDSNGLAVGGSISSHYHYGGSLWGFGAHVDFDYWVGLGVAISPDPTYGIHLHGEFDAGVSVSAGIDTPVGCLCVNPSVGIHFTADAMPIKVCGGAYVKFGCIKWCLVGCKKCYGVTLNVCL